MYSIVLMAALTSGAEAPDAHRHGGGCNGGYGGCSGAYYGGGYGGCYGGGYGGCYGGGYVSSGCNGGGHRLFGGHGGGGCNGGGHGLFSRHRNHGCNGGCSGAYYGGGYGGCSGAYYGGGYGGCSGMYTGGAYYGGCQGSFGGGMYPGGCSGMHTGGMYPGGCQGGVIVQPPVKEMIKPPVEEKKPGGDVSAPATVVVNVPAQAKLLFNGKATSSTDAVRTFVSPALQPNREYSYTITAEVMVNNQAVTQTRTVTVRAGQQTNVEFSFPTATASR